MGAPAAAARSGIPPGRQQEGQGAAEPPGPRLFVVTRLLLQQGAERERVRKVMAARASGLTRSPAASRRPMVTEARSVQQLMVVAAH